MTFGCKYVNDGVKLTPFMSGVNLEHLGGGTTKEKFKDIRLKLKPSKLILNLESKGKAKVRSTKVVQCTQIKTPNLEHEAMHKQKNGETPLLAKFHKLKAVTPSRPSILNQVVP